MNERRKLKKYEMFARESFITARRQWMNAEPIQVPLEDPFEEDPKFKDVTVPEVMAPLVKELWKRNVKIFDFRQESNSSYCELSFERLKESRKFLRLVLPSDTQLEESDDDLGIFEDLVAGDSTREGAWRYSMFPWRPNGEKEVEISIDIFFPPDHIEKILGLIKGKRRR